MKKLNLLLISFYFTIGLLNAQTKVHYLFSNEVIHVGDSVKITPVLMDAMPNSKVEMLISDYEVEVSKNKIEPFIFSSAYSGKNVLRVCLTLSANNKTYFVDTQLLTFNVFPLKANIYSVLNPLIIFIGVDNPIELDVPGTLRNDIMISAQGVMIKYNGDKGYVATSNGNQEGKGFISVAIRKNDQYVKVNEIPILIKSAPTPSILARISQKDSCIYLNSVLNDQFIYNFKSGVDSFTLVYEKEGKKTTKQFSGNKIDSNTYLEIMSLPKNTWIYFENIQHWIGLWGPKKRCVSNFAIKL